MYYITYITCFVFLCFIELITNIMTDHSKRLKFVQSVASQNLTDKERAQVIAAVQDYQADKLIEKFTKRLIVALKPAGKLELLKDIRNIVYHGHIAKFDSMLMSYNGFKKSRTTPFTMNDNYSTASTIQQNGRSLTAPVILNVRPPSADSDLSHKVRKFRNIKQKPNFCLPNKNLLESPIGAKFKVESFNQEPAGDDNLGFSICGGKGNGNGIYVGHVEVGSKAEAKGIVVGDALVEVNGISLEQVALTSAISLLRNLKQLKFIIRTGRQPMTIRHLKAINPWFVIFYFLFLFARLFQLLKLIIIHFAG